MKITMTDSKKSTVGTRFVPAAQPRNKRINLRVTEEEKEWIDRVASRNGGNASDVIREALRVLKKEMDGDKHVV